MARHSGMQLEVLSLYRGILRAAAKKNPLTRAFARERFLEVAATATRTDFNKIEFLMRQGHKQLRLLQMAGVKGADSTQKLKAPVPWWISRRSFSSLSGGSSGRSATVSSNIAGFATTPLAPFGGGGVGSRREFCSTSTSTGSRFDAPAAPRVHVVSLGCSRNWVDSEVMLGKLLQAGYEVEVDDPERASLLVVNTCGFLGSARDEADEHIEALSRVKTAFRAKADGDAAAGEDGAGAGIGPRSEAKLVVTGCMANLHKDAIIDRHPMVDHVLGAGAIDRILDVGRQESVVDALERPALERVVVPEQRSYLEAGEAPPRHLATPPHLAYLKISEGCRKSCTFCIIPKIKGPLRSKPQHQVVKELKALLASGVREVTVIAQDLGDYGKDMGGAYHQRIVGARRGSAERDQKKDVKGISGVNGDAGEEVEVEDEERASAGEAPMTVLLRDMLESTSDQEYWLRLLYLYPDEITPELVDLMANDQRLLPYFDIPMQHVAAPVLKKMGRRVNYDRSTLEATLQMLRERLPASRLTIRTTLMVGFPGETEEDFQQLLTFVKEQDLDHIGVFEFSPEEGARATSFPNHVPAATKRRRRLALEAAHARAMTRRHRRWLQEGRELEVMIDVVAGASGGVARHTGQALDVDGVVRLHAGRDAEGGEQQQSSPIAQPGERWVVQLSGAERGALRGSLKHRLDC